MKRIKLPIACALAACFLAGPLTALADDSKSGKAKPYPLKTCVVSGEKLGEHGDPYVFTNDGQEIKLCCKSCLKDFKKDPAKYLKKIEEGDKPAKK